MEIPSGWRSFFHQYEHKTKIVLSPCERELLGSMCCPLLLLHLRVKKTKNNPPAPPRKGRKQKKRCGRSPNTAMGIHHLKESDWSRLRFSCSRFSDLYKCYFKRMVRERNLEPNHHPTSTISKVNFLCREQICHLMKGLRSNRADLNCPTSSSATPLSQIYLQSKASLWSA